VAANTGALGAVLFVQHNAQRDMERPMSQLYQIVMQRLDTGFMADGGMRERRGLRRIGRVFAACAMYMIEILRLQVVGRQLFVADRPGGGNTAMMANSAEILFTETKQRSAIEL